jgi:hypothetical protein
MKLASEGDNSEEQDVDDSMVWEFTRNQKGVDWIILRSSGELTNWH